MSYQERRAVASLFSAILISVFYFAYLLQRYPAASPYSADLFRFWGSSILVFIPVSIAANIAIQIVVTMAHTMSTKEKEPPLLDERDRLIELRSTRNAIYVFAVGFLLAMGSLAIGMPPSVMFIVLMVSGVLTEIVGALSQLYLYRRGL
jgi:hypothetical protein